MIPESEWEWFGCAGHCIVADDCLFHLTTVVGKHVISTIGSYQPSHKFARRSLGGPCEEIGYERKYETMVFAMQGACSDPSCDCGAGPTHDGHNVDFTGYDRAEEAQAGHLAMCRKWAE